MRAEGYWIVKRYNGKALIRCCMCDDAKLLSTMGYLMIGDKERYCSVCGTKMTGIYEIVEGARTNNNA